MLQSLKLSHLILRITLAIVFIWFGVDRFIHPQYWIDAWLPQTVAASVERVGLGANDLVYFVGIIEVLIGISLLSSLMLRFFAFLGIVLLLVAMVFHGFNEILIRDIALIGALLALIVWPERRFV